MANVKIYSLKADGNKNLSKNFKVKEFRCKDGSDTIKICQETVNILQEIRDYFGKPVTINSAYRTPSHNKKVGGASSSQHVVGTAADIRVHDVPSWAVAAFLEDNYPIHGIGFYPTFVHVDSRGRKVYWKNTGSNVVSTFGKMGNYKKYKAKETVVIDKEQNHTEEEDEVMTGQEIYEALIEYTQGLSIPDWAVDEYQEAIDAGITDGTNPMKLIPRYEAAIMAKRAFKNR